jgi:hypothetical protein
MLIPASTGPKAPPTIEHQALVSNQRRFVRGSRRSPRTAISAVASTREQHQIRHIRTAMSKTTAPRRERMAIHERRAVTSSNSNGELSCGRAPPGIPAEGVANQARVGVGDGRLTPGLGRPAARRTRVAGTLSIEANRYPRQGDTKDRGVKAAAECRR